MKEESKLKDSTVNPHMKYEVLVNICPYAPRISVIPVWTKKEGK